MRQTRLPWEPLRDALLALTVLCMLAGCAGQRPPAGTGATQHWQGKMAVRVHSTPEQAFSANFDLQGDPRSGELVLSTILGTTMARLEWRDGTASLHTSTEERHFDSLETLAREVTGADIPVAGLFAWLQGQQVNSGHWQADLSQLDSGRIVARSAGEGTPAELKIILDN